MIDPLHPENRLKSRTLLSFACGLSCLLCVLLTQSTILTRGYNLLKFSELHLDSTSKIWDNEIRNILQDEIKNHITSDTCDLIATSSYFDPLPPVTWYHFDFVLASDFGQYSHESRYDLDFATSQMMNDLRALHVADALKISVSRGYWSSSLGLFSYSKEAVSKDGKFRKSTSGNNRGGKPSGSSDSSDSKSYNNTTEARNRKYVKDHNNINYILEADLRSGRVPLIDIMSRYSSIPSKCASDPGCSYIRMMYYVTPTGHSHFHIINSLASLSDHLQNTTTMISGVTLPGKASIILYNADPAVAHTADKRYINSLLRLSRKHLRELVGIPQVQHKSRKQSDFISKPPLVEMSDSKSISAPRISECERSEDDRFQYEGITPMDILNFRARRLSPLFFSAIDKLSATSEIQKARFGQLQSSMNAMNVNKFNAAIEMLLQCQQMVLRSSIGRTNKSSLNNYPDGKNSIKSDGIEEYHPSIKNSRSSNSDRDIDKEDSNMYTAHIDTDRGSLEKFTVTLEKLHELALQANILANELSVDPSLLPPVYYPIDQQIVMYAPYWMPIIVPIAKGLCNLFWVKSSLKVGL